MHYGSREQTMQPLQQRLRLLTNLKKTGNRARMTWEEKASWRNAGSGGMNTAAALSTSSTKWVLPRTGTENVSPWTKAALTQFWKYLSNYMKKDYIYKGSRIVNWCPVCKTSISDAEVEHVEQDGLLLAYQLSGSRRSQDVL